MPPTVSITEAQGAPVIPPDVDFGMVLIGASSDSPLPPGQLSPLYSVPAILFGDFGVGDAVDAGMQALTRTDGNPAPPPLAFYRTPATNPGTYQSFDSSGVTGTALVSTLAGSAPLGTYQITARVKDDGNDGAGGEVGTAGIFLEFKLGDGEIAFMPEVALGTAFTIDVDYPDGTFTGAAFQFDVPAAQVTAFIAAAVEARAKTLAHLADLTVHLAADTSAEQIALAASSPPTTAAEAWAVMNLARAAYEAHRPNITVHPGPDPVNVITHLAATDTHTGISLYKEYRIDFNAHLGVALPADQDGLKASFASSASPVTLTNADFLDAAEILMDLYPRRVTITTAGVTPADAPDTVDITGFDYLIVAQSELGFAVSQVAGTVTTTKAWRGTGLSMAFAAGQGTGALLEIGYGQGVHTALNNANLLTATIPNQGTLFTGDTWTVDTLPPQWANADLFVAGDPATGAFAVIAENSQEFGMVVLTEPISSASFATLTAGLNYALSKGKRWTLIARFRDPTPGETDAAYITAFRVFAASNQDDRIHCVVGSFWLTDAFRGYVYLRSGLPAVLARYQGNAVIPGRLGEKIAQHPGFVARGALEGASLVDRAGNLIGHDENHRSGIEGPVGAVGGGLTFFRIPDPDHPGVYVVSAPVMYAAGSKIITKMDRHLANGMQRVASSLAWDEIGGADIWDPATFKLDDSIRNALASKIGTALRDRYGLEFQNAGDPNLVFINPTVTVNAERVTISGALNVRFYGWTYAVQLTFSATR